MICICGGVLWLLTTSGARLSAAEAVAAPSAIHPNEALPLIVLDRVPLPDAIANLARQVDFNFMLAPRLTPAAKNHSAGPTPEPLVSRRWTNLSAPQALRLLLEEHGLTLATNPATSVVRIAATHAAARAAANNLAAGDTNPPIAQIRLDAVPLADAVRMLAAQARLDVTLNPELPVPSPGPREETVSTATVSVGWKGLRPRQALVALLENYDLILVEDRPGASAWIMRRESAEAPAGGRGPANR